MFAKLLLVGYIAAALEAKKDISLMKQMHQDTDSKVGLRESESSNVKTKHAVLKAQGRCGKDTLTCSDGEVVSRDPTNTCRFAHCGTSLIQESSARQPTYSWGGVSTIAEGQNFCARMTSVLGDFQDLSVQQCEGHDPDDCGNHYVHIIDGNVGDIEHCELSGTDCVAGAIHNCTWSFYMEDLISKHGSSEDNCASKLLEAKRSLDGLLHSVQDVYNQLMQWNAIVQAENATIRQLLEDQQNEWDVYVAAQESCDDLYQTDEMGNIENEMEELRAIANPSVRSAVNVIANQGYQTEENTRSADETNMQCDTTFRYVNTVETNYCCRLQSAVSVPPGDECVQHDCTNARKELVACLDNGMLDAGPSTAALLEVDESTCQSFASLVDRVEKKHGKKVTQSTLDCHAERANLQATFDEAWANLEGWYEDESEIVSENRSICLNEATYAYKSAIEGLGGIDDQIQDAAGKIHEAQGQIARLEPMLHDVERAVDRMRHYVDAVTGECSEESYIGEEYEKIRDLILELNECPGRNDFVIDVPHWTPSNLDTPAPTPWYDDPKAEAVRSKL